MIGRKTFWEGNVGEVGMLPIAIAGPLERPLLRPEDLLSSPGSTTPGCNLSKH